MTHTSYEQPAPGRRCDHWDCQQAAVVVERREQREDSGRGANGRGPGRVLARSLRAFCAEHDPRSAYVDRTGQLRRVDAGGQRAMAAAAGRAR